MVSIFLRLPLFRRNGGTVTGTYTTGSALGLVHKLRNALHGLFRVAIYPPPPVTLKNPDLQCILAYVTLENCSGFTPPPRVTRYGIHEQAHRISHFA